MSTFPSRRFRPALCLLVALQGACGPLVWALPGLPGVAAPATSAAPAPVNPFTAEAIAARRAEVQKQIAATRSELAKLPEGISEDPASWLTQETALLERIDAVGAEQQRTWQHAADLAKAAAEVEERTRTRRPAEATLKPPFGLALLDQLYTERDELEQAGVALKRDVANAETALQEARATLGDKDRDRRAVRGAAEKEVDAKTAPVNLRIASLECQLAEETLLLREHALKSLKLEQSLLEPKGKLLRPRFEWLRVHLILGPEEAAALEQKQLKRAAELDRAISLARREAEKVTQVVIATERRGATEKNSEELESRRANRQTANLTLSVLTAQRERLAEEATVLATRQRVLGDEMSAPELRALAEANQAALDQLERERRRDATVLLRNRQELQDWQSRLTRAPVAGETIGPWAGERVKRLMAWIELSQAETVDVDRLRTGRRRMQEEIGERVHLFSWRNVVPLVRDGAVAAWNYEVFSVQDQPVRVKTILTVLLLVVLGFHGARWGSERLSHTVFRRLGLNTGRRAAWQTLGFYALFLLVLAIAFNLFHISLTQFSVVSGALAVGIGFGSQNLISNFLSGIILLIEQPVNQGDVIEIDGQRVTVERLGPRSTIVRTLDNTHVIVPNSRLLEQPVINWTLSDNVVRRHFRVGVAYGSDTRKVSTLLQDVMGGLEPVRKEPPPFVEFADFGDSALVFEIYFWVGVESPMIEESELRHRIAEALAAAGIVIAFPQRDVHLATAKPLQVVIARATGGGEVKPAAEGEDLSPRAEGTPTVG